MARLTAAERDALPSSDFADPAHRKYPIEDAAHADNAKARASQFAGPKLKAKVDKMADKKLSAGGRADHGDSHYHETMSQLRAKHGLGF